MFVDCGCQVSLPTQGLKLLSAEFVTSAAAGGRSDGIPRDNRLHVALAGRSNVGKSSLINALCRARIARTSAAPGKTRLANVYRVTLTGGPGGPGQWSVYLVDLPGYGYARQSKESARDDLPAVAEAYIRETVGSALVLLVVDSRHPGLDSDRAAAGWLSDLGVPCTVVATKIDKLSRAERARKLRAHEETFETAVLPVSAESGEGLDALWQMIATTARAAR